MPSLPSQQVRATQAGRIASAYPVPGDEVIVGALASLFPQKPFKDFRRESFGCTHELSPATHNGRLIKKFEKRGLTIAKSGRRLHSAGKKVWAIPSRAAFWMAVQTSLFLWLSFLHRSSPLWLEWGNGSEVALRCAKQPAVPLLKSMSRKFPDRLCFSPCEVK